MSEKNPSGVPEQDIIELTDVIEDAGMVKSDATAEAEGMDMGFQQELDDLFAEGGVAGEAKPAPQAGPIDSVESPQTLEDDLDLSNLESGADFDLRLPEEESAQSSFAADDASDPNDIDVAGLDALLDDGKISQNEPVADDGAAFTDQADPGYAPVGDPGGLEDLDSLLAASDLGPDPDEALAGDGPQDADLIDLDSLMADSGLEAPYTPEGSYSSEAGDSKPAEEPSTDAVAQRLADIENKLEQIAAAQHLAVMDLADSLKMAKSAAIDLDALAAALEPVIERMLTSDLMIERAQEVFDERMAALEGKLAGSLAERVKEILDDRLAALTPATASPDLSETLAGLSASVNAALETQLAALRDAVFAEMRQLAPDAQALTQTITQALGNELRAEIDQAVPAAAAKIIREEIAALDQEAD